MAEGVPDMGTHPSPQATAQSLVNHPMLPEHLLCGSTVLNAGDPAGSTFSTQSAFPGGEELRAQHLHTPGS